MSVFANSTHVEPERSAFAAIESSHADVVRPFTRVSSPTGTTPSCASRAAKACGSISYFASPALAEKVIHAEIARDERKTGKNRIGSPRTTPRRHRGSGFAPDAVGQLHPGEPGGFRPRPDQPVAAQAQPPITSASTSLELAGVRALPFSRQPSSRRCTWW